MTLFDASRLPAALRLSAVPRWSHRDPVEGGNPFSDDNPRCPVWDEATHTALKALARFDTTLAREESHPTDAGVYLGRVIGLAEARFGVWARRVATVVRCETARLDFECWLEQYVDNWLVYVSETCPHIDVRDDLEARLRERADYWAAEAGRTVAGRG